MKSRFIHISDVPDSADLHLSRVDGPKHLVQLAVEVSHQKQTQVLNLVLAFI